MVLIPSPAPEHRIRLLVAGLTLEYPGWSFRHDSTARRWLAEAPVTGGTVCLGAESPDALRALLGAARGQVLVVP